MSNLFVRRFLKGLAVVDDIAYFGISPQAPRSARDDPASNNDLAAFDLVSGNLLWRRTVSCTLLHSIDSYMVVNGRPIAASGAGVDGGGRETDGLPLSRSPPSLNIRRCAF